MKIVKKITGIVLAFAIIMLSAISAFAANAETEREILSHEFNAYQIFSATGVDGKYLSDVEWGNMFGSGTRQRNLFINEIKTSNDFKVNGVNIFADCVDADDFARVLSVVLVEVAFGGVVMAYQYFKGRTFYYADYWKYGIRLAIRMLPHYLAGMILNQGDRVMIDRMVGRSEVALYGVAYSVGMLAQIFVSAVNSAITPWLYAKVGSHRTDEIKKTSTFLVIAIAAVAMLLMLVSPEAIYLFGSSKYADAVYVIPPVAASVYFIFLYSLLSFPQFYFERTAFLMQASLIAAAANIVLNYIFIGMFGYVAAGYTTLFCYIVYAIGHYVVSRRVLRLENEGTNSIVNTQAVVLVSAILILFTIVVNFVLGYRFVRYGMLLLLMIVGIVNRKKILYYIAAIRNRK